MASYALYLILFSIWSIAVLGNESTATRIAISSIDYAELLAFDQSSVQHLANTLATLGIAQIKSIPGFNSMKQSAMDSFADCMLSKGHNTDGIETKNMPDGSLRLTAQAVTVDGVPVYPYTIAARSI